jgi:hypothetical protein
MSEYQLIRTWLEVALGDLWERVRRDERGLGVAEWIVITGASLIGTAAVGLILWGKLKGGAESIEVPSPAAP